MAGLFTTSNGQPIQSEYVAHDNCRRQGDGSGEETSQIPSSISEDSGSEEKVDPNLVNLHPALGVLR